mmetsp:Transcript_117/g.137  ORF Transcript_117/g.137 Transcript_117/m.137 type:complete len:107 (+) Transcript_117:80-400(+)
MGTKKPCTPPSRSTNNDLQTLNTMHKIGSSAYWLGPPSPLASPFSQSCSHNNCQMAQCKYGCPVEGERLDKQSKLLGIAGRSGMQEKPAVHLTGKLRGDAAPAPWG